MSALTVDRLREMLGRETNRAALAERQMRDMAADMVRLKARIAELESTQPASPLALSDGEARG